RLVAGESVAARQDTYGQATTDNLPRHVLDLSAVPLTLIQSQSIRVEVPEEEYTKSEEAKAGSGEESVEIESYNYLSRQVGSGLNKL
ncbi:hypothetical protein GW17_00039918, partial [Ensete ventricosum]